MNGRAMFAFVIPLDGTPVDPGYGQGRPPTDPGYGHGGFHPVDPGFGHGGGLHPGNALPTPPVKPSVPITLPPGVWPPRLPPGVDNTLPPLPEGGHKPIVLPPDPDLGIENPIVIPPLPVGVALLIALPQAQPKAGTPPGTVPAILVQSGKTPVVVYVSAGATPK